MYIRDVIFIKDKFYKSDKLDLGLIEDVKEIVEYFKILPSRPVFEQKKSDFDEKELSYVYD